MDFIAIEINELQLVVHDSVSSVKYGAYACIQKDKLIFGDEALSYFKLAPDDFFSHFWQRLGYEEIKSKNTSIKHFADLAYQQLFSITEKYEANRPVVFIVPAYYKEQDLSLLLGLAESCKLKTLALINQDILNAKTIDYIGDYSIGQLGIHDCNLANVHINQEITLNNNTTFKELGFLELVSYISNWCNQKFIKHIRFDALHSAKTEQSLFIQIYQLLIQIAKTGEYKDYDIAIKEKSIKLAVNDLQDKVTEFFSELFDNKTCSSSLYLTPQLYNLTADPYHKNKCELLKKPDVFSSIQNLLPHIKQQSGVCLLEQIPTVKLCKQDDISNINHATHIVFKNISVAFNNEPIYLNNFQSKRSQHPFSRNETNESFAVLIPNGNKIRLASLNDKRLTVNGKPIKHDALLSRKDTISTPDNFNFELISVLEEF